MNVFELGKKFIARMRNDVEMNKLRFGFIRSFFYYNSQRSAIHPTTPIPDSDISILFPRNRGKTADTALLLASTSDENNGFPMF